MNATGGTLVITHVNGQAVGAGQTITLNSGQQVTLNANGTLTILGDGDVETVNFTYTAQSSTGATDVGFVTVSSVPCFVAGTLVEHPSTASARCKPRAGRPGRTLDNGYQPLRWIGQRTVPAQGVYAPIRIAGGTLGDHDTIMVSPQHRVLVQDVLAHLLFGEPEVLVAARYLVNDMIDPPVPGGSVDYVHLIFDRHQIIRANGLWSESFLPGARTKDIFEAETMAEIAALFPRFDPTTGDGYGSAARRILRSYEARLLRPAEAAA